MKDLRVFCADIGSVKAGKFGWASVDSGGACAESGSDIGRFSTRIVDHLAQQKPAAVGFECPLFVPFRADPRSLTLARDGEGSRPWSAGAGTGALATGLVEVVWVLDHVRRGLTEAVTPHLDWGTFADGGGLFLWEAFVSGVDKPPGEGNPHAADAMAAARAFVEALPDPRTANAVAEPMVTSLIGMALLRTGWTDDIKALATPCLVIKPGK